MVFTHRLLFVVIGLAFIFTTRWPVEGMRARAQGRAGQLLVTKSAAGPRNETDIGTVGNNDTSSTGALPGPEQPTMPLPWDCPTWKNDFDTLKRLSEEFLSEGKLEEAGRCARIAINVHVAHANIKSMQHDYTGITQQQVPSLQKLGDIVSEETRQLVMERNGLNSNTNPPTVPWPKFNDYVVEKRSDPGREHMTSSEAEFKRRARIGEQQTWPLKFWPDTSEQVHTAEVYSEQLKAQQDIYAQAKDENT